MLLLAMLMFMYLFLLRTEKKFWDKPAMEKFYVVFICFYTFVMVVDFMLAKFFSIGTFDFI